MSLADAARAMRLLLDTAAEVTAEAAAAAAAAEAAVEAAAAEKANRIAMQAREAEALAPAHAASGAGLGEDSAPAATGGAAAGGKRVSRVGKWLRRMSSSSGGAKSPSDSVHPTKACTICLDLLGTEGGVQALGCMDCFCRHCIALHIATRSRQKHEITCPMCQRAIPEEEQEECGPPPKPQAPPPKPNASTPGFVPSGGDGVPYGAGGTHAYGYGAGGAGTGGAGGAGERRAFAAVTAADVAAESYEGGAGPGGGAAERRSSLSQGREWLAGLAVAAVNAPALLRAGPAALEAAAIRLRNGGGGRGRPGRGDDPDWEEADFDDDDFVVMEDGSYQRFGRTI